MSNKLYSFTKTMATQIKANLVKRITEIFIKELVVPLMNTLDYICSDDFSPTCHATGYGVLTMSRVRDTRL